MAALVLALGTAACGAGRAAQGPATVTVNLPAYANANDSSAIGHLPASGRRMSAHAGRAASGAAAAGSAVALPGAISADVAAAGIRPLSPRANARLNGVAVWIPYWGLSAAVADAIANRSVVRVAHPFLYQVQGTDTIEDESGGQGPAVSRELSAAGLEVIPTVTESDGMGAFANVLGHPRAEAGLLRALEGIADQPGNAGIDLDFESLAIGSNDARQVTQVETGYPRMLARLCAALHRHDRSCEVTVMAKNTPGLADGDGLNTYVYDYAALGAVVDRVQIMAYDDHTPSGAAGPVAPWPWVQSVIAYASSQIPADKLVLGIPAYGYEWDSDGHASSLTATAAEALAAQVHATISWNAADAEPTFSWSTTHTTTRRITRSTSRKLTRHKRVTRDGVTKVVTETVSVHGTRTVTQRTRRVTDHVVWFEDSTADADRAVLAADDRLAGVAIWAGGDESPGLWAALGRLR